MKNHRKKFTIVIGFVVIFAVILFSSNIFNEKTSANQLPTLMDAKGKLEIKKGDFDLENQPFLGDKNVKKDFKISAANGIFGTPTFLVNGIGVDTIQLREKVLEQLQ
ncbi:DsbA family protein [Paenibacillus riograndensis]|uniref:Uncharacterized protein n=1 Tax=Paenibacillus riograndensis SBR5 TaxID=1073571 RepID=A0A0E3WHC6_9BACL|nr:DsbA family protein [Paenibacillus riograndensis]CQR55053.1 hypothetical protein PRIO_2649 [Paenibacillus riograndensis SBR5]